MKIYIFYSNKYASPRSDKIIVKLTYILCNDVIMAAFGEIDQTFLHSKDESEQVDEKCI